MSAQASAKSSGHGLGRLGVWSMELRSPDSAFVADAAAELEELGYGALWFPGGFGGPILETIDALLAATRKAVIATGILNVWKHEPADVGAWWRGVPADRQARVMLGLGVSHGPIIGEAYQKPLQVMREYLDKLDAEGLPAERRCIAALAPKMLALSRDRSAGSHPYLTTPEHTAYARELLGPAALLAPEQGVIFETDADKARARAREAVAIYAKLPNYVSNWKRLGFTDEDVASSSDRLIDALFAWGDADRIAARVNAHLEAGADHVCIQVISSSPGGKPDVEATRRAWRELAPARLGVPA